MHRCNEDAAASKTATLTLRIQPEIKEAPKRAAELGHRSIANMVEVLIPEHCRVEEIATDVSSNNNHAGKGASS